MTNLKRHDSTSAKGQHDQEIMGGGGHGAKVMTWHGAIGQSRITQ